VRSALRKKVDEERKRRSREALLEAARTVFARKGYHATLISDIVGAAGVGQGTFYRHFRSKREIFERLIDRFTERMLGEFSAMSSALPMTVEAYQAASVSAISRIAAIIDDNREIMRLILHEAPSIDEAFKTKIDNISQQFAVLAKFYLDHAIANGFARPCRTDVVAQSLVGIGLHLMDVWWSGMFPNITREALIEEVVTLAFRGFGVFEEEGHGSENRKEEGGRDGRHEGQEGVDNRGG